MRKIHTKTKRKWGIRTHNNPYSIFHPRKRERAKTFKTEESAKAWAEKKGLKDYSLERTKSGRKFKVAEKEE